MGVNRPRGLGMWGIDGDGALKVAIAQTPEASRRIPRRWRSNRRAVPQQCADILNFSTLTAGPRTPILHGKTQSVSGRITVTCNCRWHVDKKTHDSAQNL